MTDDPERRKHHWIGWGYDTTICKHCRINEYETRTTYCDEVEDEKRINAEKADRRHTDTEEAIAVARAALTKEQWTLLGLDRMRPYRDIDRIVI